MHMSNDYNQFEKRKQDHIALALMPVNQADECNTFDTIKLAHEALPDLNFNEIELRSSRFSEVVVKPFLVSSMTAGHQDAGIINRNLLEACHSNGWAMGVGSQRRELSDEMAAREWHSLRADFPTVPLFSNIGIAQLLEVPHHKIQKACESLNARALIIHCNPLQEVIQPEGTPHFKGCWHRLEQLVLESALPVIVKETGCGFSKTTLQRLNDIGVAAVDISGLGGTHWGRIEGHRAVHNGVQQTAAITFKNWGVDTISSIKAALSCEPNFEIWGSGGVRNGLDAAKLLALGATTVGFAKPMLESALRSAEDVSLLMQTIEYELRVAMFCTGSRCISDLKEKVCP